jgi:cytidylate kinase
MANEIGPGGLRVIAIDGPVASGKTVIGKAVAERLHWPMLDTGIMYRALTWAAIDRGLLPDPAAADPAALVRLANEVELRVGTAAEGSPETASIAVDGVDATPQLRSKAVEAAVSVVASVAGVRERMVEQQQEMARRGEVVMVGRDIGTVVAREALVKIYLHASDEVRAARRAEQMRASGRPVSDDEVLSDLQRRDATDQSRATAPLRRASGAEDVDTSSDDLDTAIERVLTIVRRALGDAAAPEGGPA